MNESNVVELKAPAEDALGELLKEGARQLLAQAIEAEVAELLIQYADQTVNGKRAVARNGYLPERSIQTGLGEVPVKVPKVRDRSDGGIKFNSKLVPPYLKRTKNVEEFIPWLYLKGISTGEMQPALEAPSVNCCCCPWTTCWSWPGNSSSPVSAVRRWIAASAVTVCPTSGPCNGSGMATRPLPSPPSGSRPTSRALCTSTSSTCPRCRTRHPASICSWPSTGPPTRWVYLEIRKDKRAKSAQAFLKALLKKAPFKIRKILTDNGKEFTDRFSAAGERQPTGDHPFDQVCQEAHIEHRLIPPRHPQTNGMVERFNGRIAEILRSERFDSSADLKQTLENYQWAYNHQIPQRALGHVSPIQALKEWQKKRPDLFVKRVYNVTRVLTPTKENLSLSAR